MILRRIIFTGLCLGFLAPAFAYAHGFGPSFESIVGDYLIDVGYDIPDFRANETVRFDFDLWKDDPLGGAKTDYTSVTVAISEESDKNQPVFETSIVKAPMGKTSLVYTFPQEGMYTLSVRYHISNELNVETSIPFTVAPPIGIWNRVPSYVAGIGGVLLGIFLTITGSAWWRHRYSRIPQHAI